MKEVLLKKLTELEQSQQTYIKQKANIEEQIILHKGAIQATVELLKAIEDKEMVDKESLAQSQYPLPDQGPSLAATAD